MSKKRDKNPSTLGANGERNKKGQFAPGNKLGRGNPLAGKVAKLRSFLLNAVTEEDMQLCLDGLRKGAKAGDVPAIKEFLDRVIGKAVEADLLERMEALEAMINELLNAKANDSQP